MRFQASKTGRKVTMRVQHMTIKNGMKVKELVNEMGRAGVLGAGRVYKATKLLSEMFQDHEMNVFLSMAGPLVAGGMRNIISDLLKEGKIQALITSGANLTHDLLEAFGGGHYHSLQPGDVKVGHIKDIYTKTEDFEVFEEKILKILESITSTRRIFSIREFIHEIGKHIEDEDSIIKNATDNNIPIYAPGIIDSMIGLQLWMFTQENQLCLDAVADMHHLSDLVFESERIGAIILGGGVPKHYTLASTILRGGVDAAIQIIMDRSEAGSLSGAPLEEARTWAKAQADSKLVTVIGDATILFPLILAGAL